MLRLTASVRLPSKIEKQKLPLVNFVRYLFVYIIDHRKYERVIYPSLRKRARNQKRKYFTRQ